jgi:MOSC domain-containing protein YiiM
MTVGGLDWRALRPGMALSVGTVRLELSYPAVPCAKQARWFADGDFGRISWDRNPRWVRWYGWVRRPGTVRAGDPVRLTPG